MLAAKWKVVYCMFVVPPIRSVIGGLGGASYVWVHRQYVLFMRSNKKMNKFLQKKFVKSRAQTIRIT